MRMHDIMRLLISININIYLIISKIIKINQNNFIKFILLIIHYAIWHVIRRIEAKNK
jgi:hypothetical protein